mgnify:CR=1
MTHCRKHQVDCLVVHSKDNPCHCFDHEPCTCEPSLNMPNDQEDKWYKKYINSIGWRGASISSEDFFALIAEAQLRERERIKEEILKILDK